MNKVTTTKRFGTFEGVFTPSLLSILGVIMYLRLGWVVGQIGLAGALAVIVFANLLTLATALSMSSVITNIRIGTGGAYSIITKSLGIEAGGAIGIPLYIAQAISIAFYITGFSECWNYVFPEHNPLAISLGTWFLLMIIVYISAKLAFKIQFVIMGLIGLSLVSIFTGKGLVPQQVIFWEGFSMKNFWYVFAIFFPAVTGILTGASLSGELRDPRKSIPNGTLWAIGVSFCVYALLTFWFAKQIPQAELIANKLIVIDLGRWRWFVIVGIFGATISSALSIFVSAPRVLLALGKHAILPHISSFAHINKRGEPTSAILLTALIALATILYGTLDQIASLLTMFFLITYGMINLTVLIEQSIGIASFRPTFRISRFFPLIGSIGCVAVMFLVNSGFSLVSLLIITTMYWILLKKEAQTHSPDVRSGMLVFLAEQFGKAAHRLRYYPKIWKPNLLIPLENLDVFARIIPFIRAIVFPAGRLAAVVVTTSKPQEEFNDHLAKCVQPLKDEGLFVETSVAQSKEYFSGVVTIIQTLKGMLFPPNTLFYILEDTCENNQAATQMIGKASGEGLGIILFHYDQKLGLSQEKILNLWIRKQSPNINLAILITLQLEQSWEGKVKLIQVVGQEYEKQEAEEYLNKIKQLMRLPLDVSLEVIVGQFQEALKKAPPADINIFGMQETVDLDLVRKVTQDIQTSVLFLKDSKHESALA